MWRFVHPLRAVALIATALGIVAGVGFSAADRFPSRQVVDASLAGKPASALQQRCEAGCLNGPAGVRERRRAGHRLATGVAANERAATPFVALSAAVPVGVGPAATASPVPGGSSPQAETVGTSPGSTATEPAAGPTPAPPTAGSSPPPAGETPSAPPPKNPPPQKSGSTPPPEEPPTAPEPPSAPEPPPAPELEPEPAPPPPIPSSDHLVVAIDGGHGGWSSAEIADREQLGAAVTRHEWDPSEPVDEKDDLVSTAASRIHTRIHALLGGNELGDATHYREWVVAFVRRYGPGGSFWSAHPELDASRYAIRTIELGNEPYFGGMSASEYADTVRPTLEAVDNLGLPVKVVLDSRIYGTDTSWMDTLYARIPNLNSLFYAFADHPYWYGHDPAEVSPAGPFGRIDALRERMDEKGAGSKPIFITEYGESTASCGGECVSEDEQAEHLLAMIVAAATNPQWDIQMLSIYQLIDRGTNSSERELQFGLLREDGTEKPSYPIVQAAVQSYRG
jgi:hypothetical protein